MREIKYEKEVNFKKLVREYQNAVYTLSFRILGSRQEAEDMTQEAFLKAYEKYDTIDFNKNVLAWLKTIATNLCINYINRYKKRVLTFSSLSKEDIQFDVPDNSMQPDIQLEKSAVSNMLEHSLANLPEDYRIPIVLHYNEGKSYEEIAEILNISLSKVKSDIFRGRQKLRELLISSPLTAIVPEAKRSGKGEKGEGEYK